MKKILLAAALLPRIYFMDLEVQRELGLDGRDLSKYEVTSTSSMDLVTTTDDRAIILIADMCDEHSLD